MAFCVRFARVVYDDMATSAEVATNSVAMTMANIVSFFLYILGILATALNSRRACQFECYPLKGSDE